MSVLLWFGLEKSVKVPAINQLVLTPRPALKVLRPMLYENFQATYESNRFLF